VTGQQLYEAYQRHVDWKNPVWVKWSQLSQEQRDRWTNLANAINDEV
jgi:hypothetical protein